MKLRKKCLDIYGNEVSEFVFNEDGTVTGIADQSTSSLLVSKSGFGSSIKSSVGSTDLSQACCNGLGFTYNVNEQKCYFRNSCTAGENSSSNAAILDEIRDLEAEIVVLEDQLDSVITDKIDVFEKFDTIEKFDTFDTSKLGNTSTSKLTYTDKVIDTSKKVLTTNVTASSKIVTNKNSVLTSPATAHITKLVTSNMTVLSAPVSTTSSKATTSPNSALGFGTLEKAGDANVVTTGKLTYTDDSTGKDDNISKEIITTELNSKQINQQIIALQGEIADLKKQIKYNDVKIILGAQGSAGALFEYGNTQEIANQEVKCEQDLIKLNASLDTFNGKLVTLNESETNILNQIEIAEAALNDKYEKIDINDLVDNSGKLTLTDNLVADNSLLVNTPLSTKSENSIINNLALKATDANTMSVKSAKAVPTTNVTASNLAAATATSSKLTSKFTTTNNNNKLDVAKDTTTGKLTLLDNFVEFDTTTDTLSSLKSQLKITRNEITKTNNNILLTEQDINELEASCVPVVPPCSLNIEFDYLWNFDCEELLNCSSGDDSMVEFLSTSVEECTDRIATLETRKTNAENRMSQIAGNIADSQAELVVLNASLEGNIDPLSIYQIQSDINNINATLIGRAESYVQYQTYVGKLEIEIAGKEVECEQLTIQYNTAVSVGGIINSLQGVVFYLTIEKKVYVGSSHTWENVYEEEFFRIDDLVNYIRNNDNTGILLNGEGCDTLLENIGILLGEDCDIVKEKTFNSDWLHLSKVINDAATLKSIVNEEITFGIRVGYDNAACKQCILLDHIEMNQTCEETNKIEVLTTECPSFELERVVDNKKSWMNVDETHVREFDLTDRGTHYKTINHKAVINSKEVDLAVDPASAIELDTYTYSEANPCVLSGGSVDYLNLMSTDIEDVNSLDEFKWTMYSELVDVKSRKVLSGYPVLRDIYERYLAPADVGCTGTTSNAYVYSDMVNFSKLLGTYWVDLLEQVVPATSIWGSVYKYRSTLFDSDKFKYKRSSLKHLKINMKPLFTECDNVMGNSGLPEVIVEDLSKTNNTNTPDCFISTSPVNTSNFVYTDDYSDSCEYRGNVTVINPIEDKLDVIIKDNVSKNTITSDGIVAQEDVTYYDRKILKS